MEEKLRVVLANDSFPPTIDGVANTVLNYAKHIQLSHGTPIVATPAYPDVVDDYPFEVVRFASLNTEKKVGYRAGYPFSHSGMKQLVEFRPHIIHSHSPVFAQFVAREARDLTHVPLVYTYHTKFDLDIARAIKSHLVQEAALKAIVANISASDEVWAVTEGAADNLRSLGFEGDIRIMFNGVDFPLGAAKPEALQALNEQYDLPADVPCFLFVGRMLWYKGQRCTLDGLKRLMDRGYDFRMVFIGSGDNYRDIGDYAEQFGLGRKVLMFENIQDRELLRAWYSRADLFLFPSTFDTNGLVVREAAACGTASVMIRDSSSALGSTDHQNCLLIRESADSMADALEEACKDPEMIRELGARAQEELYMPWDEKVAQAVARYKELIDLNVRGELPPRPKAQLDSFIKFVSTLAKPRM